MTDADWDDELSDASLASIRVDERGDEFWVVWRGEDHRGPWPTSDAADKFAASLHSQLVWKRGQSVAGTETDADRRRRSGDFYADGYLDGQESAKELLAAAEDYTLHHGAHEGPCDNLDDEGEPNGDVCDLHIEASDRRNARLLEAVRAFKESYHK